MEMVPPVKRRWITSPTQNTSSVDVQHLSGDVAGEARAEKENGTGDVFARGDPAKGNGLLDSLPVIGGERGQLMSVSTQPGRNAIHRDVGERIRWPVTW